MPAKKSKTRKIGRDARTGKFKPVEKEKKRPSRCPISNHPKNQR